MLFLPLHNLVELAALMLSIFMIDSAGDWIILLERNLDPVHTEVRVRKLISFNPIMCNHTGIPITHDVLPENIDTVI